MPTKSNNIGGRGGARPGAGRKKTAVSKKAKNRNPGGRKLEKLAHGGHPVLRWIMDNIFIRTDPAGNIKPDKKSTEKIYGAVATIMALDRAIRCGWDSGTSVYDERGILVL